MTARRGELRGSGPRSSLKRPWALGSRDRGTEASSTRGWRRGATPAPSTGGNPLQAAARSRGRSEPGGCGEGPAAPWPRLRACQQAEACADHPGSRRDTSPFSPTSRARSTSASSRSTRRAVRDRRRCETRRGASISRTLVLPAGKAARAASKVCCARSRSSSSGSPSGVLQGVIDGQDRSHRVADEDGGLGTDRRHERIVEGGELLLHGVPDARLRRRAKAEQVGITSPPSSSSSASTPAH